MTQLQKGTKAPSFSLLNQNDKMVSLEDFRGKKLLIYFYPRADTPGCTTQSCSVSESLNHLKELSVEAIGISPDAPLKLKKFDEKYNLGFTLLSDFDHNTAQAFGAFGEKIMYGKKKEGIIRSAFLLDENGYIIEAWYKVKPADTVPNVLSTLS